MLLHLVIRCLLGSKSESFVTVVESIESDSNILSKNAKNIQPTSLEDSVDFPEPTTGQTNEEFQKHDHSQSVKTEKVEYTLPPTNTVSQKNFVDLIINI